MLSRIGALLMVFAVSCAATQSKPLTPWRVEVSTSGGIAGRGIGTYSIDSEGNINVVTMTKKSCAFRATDEDLRRFETLLASSRPAQWGRYIPENSCCDRIEYALAFTEADRTFKTAWIDDPLPMPEDLVKLSEAIVGGGEDSIRRKYGDQCR